MTQFQTKNGKFPTFKRLILEILKIITALENQNKNKILNYIHIKHFNIPYHEFLL